MSARVVSGGCRCGAVRYEATGGGNYVTHCHCSDCRRSSGAPYVTWISFARRGFQFTKGSPRETRWEGRLRSFCSECGTPLTFLAKDFADEIDVTVGSLDEPEQVVPVDHTWMEDRLPWIQLADNLPTFSRSRPER